MLKHNIIPIIKGDDTNWNDEQSFIIHIDTTNILGLDLSDGYRAEFKLGSIVKYFDTIENNRIEPVLTHKDTSTLPLGHIDGSVKIIDSNNRVKTFKSDIHFQVKSGVFCWRDPCEVDIYVTTGSYDKLSDKPKINGVELRQDLSAEDLGLASREDLIAISNLLSEKASIEEVKELLEEEIDNILKPATEDTLGGIKVGEGLKIDEDGTLSVIESSGTGTSDYEDLTNKPSINNVELTGDKSLDELGIPDKSSVTNLQTEVALIKNQLNNTLVFEEI